MKRDTPSSGSRRPGAAWILAASLLVPACGDDVGEGDQPGIYTVRISETLDGTEANARCEYPSISADGRYIAFSSKCSTLVPNDANNITDIFIKDRTTGAYENITLLSTGEFGPYPRENSQVVISADGRYVAFESYGIYIAAGISPSSVRLNLWRYDRQTGIFRVVADLFNWPNASLTNPSISADGRYVAFQSAATNLVTGITPAASQVWVADFANVVSMSDLPVITLVSRAAGAGNGNTPADAACEHPRISGDGSSIVFQSGASNLHAASTGMRDIYLGTPLGAEVEFVSWAEPGVPLDGALAYPSVSYNGDFVAFAVGGVDTIAHPTLPRDGVVRRNRVTSTTELVADDDVIASFVTEPVDRTSISADGRFVAYTAAMSGETYAIRVRDMSASMPFTASVHISGALPQLSCERPFLSADGRWVVWQTEAANLVTGDTNGLKDIYVRGPLH
jgi:Tol biopolymer transport system component